MSKTITRKYIQRITRNENSTSIRRNSGGGGGGGGVSQYWVDDNYVSKEFFNRLFEIHDENGDPILPNDVETEIDNIQAMFGFWTNAYLSALGQNEGGGGAELTLASLADVAVQGVTDGQALVWSASRGKWVPGEGGGGLDPTAMWAELATTGTQQINKTHLTTALADYLPLAGGTMTNTNLVTNMNADLLDGHHAADFALASAITDMATQTWVSTNYLSKTDASSTYLTKTEANTTYLSIAFFRALFRAYTSGGSEVVPNDGSTSTIDNIKAMFGFWTNSYLSALGNNPGGASLTLSSLSDVSISGATAGQVLTYRNGTWRNETPQGGGTDMQTVWQELAATGTQQINATHLTTALADYLPLTGGTMTNTNLVTNMNADLLDGRHATDFAYGTNGIADSASTLTNKTVTSSTLDSLAGSFTFQGDNLINSATDYVGMQIGSAYDKIQIAGQAGSLMIRQNDNGGTSTSGWTEWTAMLTANNYANYITGFVTLDTAQTISGIKTFSNTVFLNAISEPSDSNGLLVYKPASGWSGISSTQWGVGAANCQGVIRSSNTNLIHYKGGTSYTIWDESNDGAGSGLDADLLDGHHAADFALASAITDMATQTWVSTNYLTKTDANNTYLSIAFFRALFRAYTSGGSEVVPNGGSTSTIDNIKAMFGFWTNSYLSALGNNPGGASLTLSSLSDVSISGATAGQVLTYRNGQWHNETPQGGGGLDPTAMWAELATTGTQQINKTHLTTALADYLPLVGGTMTGDLTFNNAQYIGWKNNAGTAQRICIGLNSSNDFLVGYTTAGSGYNTYLDGNSVQIRYGTSRSTGIYLNSSGNVGIGTLSPAYKLDVNGDVRADNFIGNLANKTVTTSTIDGLAGSFTFEGNNLTTSGYDEVGIQIGSSVDKFQIIGKSGTLLVRQNDNGGTSTSGWSGWTMLPTKVFTSNQLTKTDQWYRVANLTIYGLSYIISIRDNFYNREPTPATFIINTSYTNATITQIGRASTTPTDITKLRVVKYGNGTFHVEVYTPKLSGSSSASMNTPEVNIFNLGRENTSDGIVLVHDPNDDTKWLEVDKNIASGETLIEEADISTGTMIAGDMLLNNAQYIGWKNKAGTEQRICIGLNSSNDFLVGYTTAGSGYNTYLDGNSVEIRYGTSRNTGIYLNSSGNVGIGTTSPSYKLHVSGICAVDEGLYKRNADSHPLSLWRATDSNQKLDIYVHDVLAVLNASDSDGWSSFSFCTNGTEYVRFDGLNKYVGIGTTSPAYKLDVNGDVQATNFRGNFVGNADSATKLKTARTIWGQSFDGTANVSGAITGATTITASSNVSVGGTFGVTGATTLSSTLGVTGNTTLSGTLSVSKATTLSSTLGVTGAATLSSTLSVISNTTVGGTLGVTGATTLSSTLSVSGTSTLTGHVGIGTTPHSTYVLRANGEVYVSTGLYSHGYVTALSDIRHKDVMGDVKLTVSEVANAPAVKFLWKDRRQEGLQVGSIAQYWKKVLPEAIVEAADGELTMSYGVVALLASIANAREIVNLKREIAELKRTLSNHGILE